MNCILVEIPGSYKRLSDLVICIAGTGATVRNTTHNLEMIELKKGGSDDSVTIGNYQKLESSKAGSIVEITIDKKRKGSSKS